VKLALFAMLAAVAAWAANPRIVYNKEFPGSVPEYAAITIQADGSATYGETPNDPEPEMFKIEPEAAEAIFQLARRLERFARPIESGMKVANMGRKTYRWEEDGDVIMVRYNHTNEEDARVLQDWFERITECERILIDLRRTARFDRLGVNDVLIRLEAAWNAKRVVGMAQFLPVLDRLAKNESYLHMARERATGLAEAFRATGKAGAE
jgi:hypothetical protein